MGDGVRVNSNFHSLRRMKPRPFRESRFEKVGTTPFSTFAFYKSPKRNRSRILVDSGSEAFQAGADLSERIQILKSDKVDCEIIIKVR